MIMGEMSLPSDKSESIVSHLTEVSIRLQRLIFAILLVAIGWAFLIDEMFSIWFASIPLAAGEGTISIYSPYAWLDTRWTAVGLLSLWTVLPWVAWEAWRFARPGLLPRERAWLSSMLAGGVLFGSTILITGWLWGVPTLVDWAQQASPVEGIGLQYDAVAIFQMALAASWFVLIAFLLTLALVLGRAFALIDDDPFNSFRLRLHFVAALSLYVVTPPALQGVFLPALITLALGAEWVAERTPAAKQPRGRTASPVLDGSGSERLILFVDCSCEGVCPRVDEKSLAPNIGVLRLNALCLEMQGQEALADRIQREKINSIVIGGCDGTPLPFAVKKSLAVAECDVTGLNRLSKSQVTGTPELTDWAESLDLARASRPWSEDSARRAQLQLIQEAPKELSALVVTESGSLPWGARLNGGEVLLTGSNRIDEALIKKTETAGIRLRVV
uniref:Sec-independent protein secretion pathway component n=1 Tax=uncultured marine group II/III euryarchaeote KM3_44_G05 TaxID=1456448 RepID=A0A075H4V1_9EURY|nr:Sec-independent protein secretion pathway component [uncultured marine group II/III euryarchaeote KM3_44_G05]